MLALPLRNACSSARVGTVWRLAAAASTPIWLLLLLLLIVLLGRVLFHGAASSSAAGCPLPSCGEALGLELAASTSAVHRPRQVLLFLLLIALALRSGPSATASMIRRTVEPPFGVLSSPSGPVALLPASGNQEGFVSLL